MAVDANRAELSALLCTRELSVGLDTLLPFPEGEADVHRDMWTLSTASAAAANDDANQQPQAFSVADQLWCQVQSARSSIPSSRLDFGALGSASPRSAGAKPPGLR